MSFRTQFSASIPISAVSAFDTPHKKETPQSPSASIAKQAFENASSSTPTQKAARRWSLNPAAAGVGLVAVALIGSGLAYLALRKTSSDKSCEVIKGSYEMKFKNIANHLQEAYRKACLLKGLNASVAIHEIDALLKQGPAGYGMITNRYLSLGSQIGAEPDILRYGTQACLTESRLLTKEASFEITGAKTKASMLGHETIKCSQLDPNDPYYSFCEENYQSYIDTATFFLQQRCDQPTS